MRSRPWKKDPIAERLAERRGGVMLDRLGPDRPFCILYDGRLRVGTQSKHRQPSARKYRCRLRIKRYARGGPSDR